MNERKDDAVLCTGRTVQEHLDDFRDRNRCAEWVPALDAAAAARGVVVPCGAPTPCRHSESADALMTDETVPDELPELEREEC